MTRSRKRARPSTPTGAAPGVALDAPGPSGSREAVVAFLTIAVATVLVYSNTFDASFHFDDLPNIVENVGLRHLSSQWPPFGNRWVGYLSFALNYRFGGLGVFGYHLANLAIHVCNGLLVSWLTALTLRTPALRRAEAGPLVRGYLPLAAGLLFAVHPVQSQAVTYVVQRFASLATLFFLLSLALYARARLSLEAETPSKARGAILYCLSVVAAAAAMKTKEISFTLPLVAALYELMFFGQRRRLSLLAPLAATALLVPYGLVTQDRSLADVLGDASHVAAETPEIPRFTYLVTQSRVVVTYLRLLLLPIRQNLDYDFRLSTSLADPAVLAAIAILLAVATLAVFLLARARKTNSGAGVLVFFGAAWFFVTLSVESSIIPIRDVIFEHRMYLPMAGAAVALGTGLLCAVERLRLRFSLVLQAAAALAITAGPLGVAAHERNLVWKDELTLWSDVVAESPGKARPHTNLARALLDHHATSEAMRESLAALEINPRDADALTNLGIAYTELQRPEDAIAAFTKAIHIDPGHAKAHNSLGVVFKARNQMEDAMREYREAVRLAPGLAEAHTNLGVILGKQGRAAEEVVEQRLALELKPMPEIVFNLGVALEAAGRQSEAIAQYQRFLDEAAQRYPDRAEKVRDRIARLRASAEASR